MIPLEVRLNVTSHPLNVGFRVVIVQRKRGPSDATNELQRLVNLSEVTPGSRSHVSYFAVAQTHLVLHP